VLIASILCIVLLGLVAMVYAQEGLGPAGSTSDLLILLWMISMVPAGMSVAYGFQKRSKVHWTVALVWLLLAAASGGAYWLFFLRDLLVEGSFKVISTALAAMLTFALWLALPQFLRRGPGLISELTLQDPARVSLSVSQVLSMKRHVAEVLADELPEQVRSEYRQLASELDQNRLTEAGRFLLMGYLEAYLSEADPRRPEDHPEREEAARILATLRGPRGASG